MIMTPIALRVAGSRSDRPDRLIGISAGPELSQNFLWSVPAGEPRQYV
jgi:hypothetical protein